MTIQKRLEINGRDVKFLTDSKFKPVRDTLDALMKRSASIGLGTNHRQATVITTAMENEPWHGGLLGDHNSAGFAGHYGVPHWITLCST